MDWSLPKIMVGHAWTHFYFGSEGDSRYRRFYRKTAAFVGRLYLRCPEYELPYPNTEENKKESSTQPKIKNVGVRGPVGWGVWLFQGTPFRSSLKGKPASQRLEVQVACFLLISGLLPQVTFWLEMGGVSASSMRNETNLNQWNPSSSISN